MAYSAVDTSLSSSVLLKYFSFFLNLRFEKYCTFFSATFIIVLKELFTSLIWIIQVTAVKYLPSYKVICVNNNPGDLIFSTHRFDEHVSSLC